jgi:hypothetical protein
MKWYDKANPTVKNILPKVKEISSKLANLNNVKGVYAWKSLAENLHNEESKIKDIDLIIDCNFDSGDLLAIDNSETGALKLDVAELEDLGYNPQAIKFTKNLLQNKLSSLEFWAISKDKKILHWGPISETIEEYKQIKKEAEKKAESYTNFRKSQLHRLTESQQNKWHEIYEQHLNDFGNGCPQGWYAAQNNIEKILPNIIQINI